MQKGANVWLCDTPLSPPLGPFLRPFPLLSYLSGSYLWRGDEGNEKGTTWPGCRAGSWAHTGPHPLALTSLLSTQLHRGCHPLAFIYPSLLAFQILVSASLLEASPSPLSCCCWALTIVPYVILLKSVGKKMFNLNNLHFTPNPMKYIRAVC